MSTYIAPKTSYAKPQNPPVVKREIEVAGFHATLTGTQGGGLIGPAIVSVVVTEFEEHRASYSVKINGRHWCGGCADHLPPNPADIRLSFLVGRVEICSHPKSTSFDDARIGEVVTWCDRCGDELRIPADTKPIEAFALLRGDDFDAVVSAVIWDSELVS